MRGIWCNALTLIAPYGLLHPTQNPKKFFGGCAPKPAGPSFRRVTPCHDTGRNPAKQKSRAADKTNAVSLREALFFVWIPACAGMTAGAQRLFGFTPSWRVVFKGKRVKNQTISSLRIRYGSVLARRKPALPYRSDGVRSIRMAARTLCGLLSQEPPRNTRASARAPSQALPSLGALL